MSFLIAHSRKIGSSAYDPYSWITGSPDRADDFETLALDASVNGRTLPTGGGTWNADAGWIGAGSGAAMSTTEGHAIKGNLIHTDCKVRMVWHPGSTGNNLVDLFARDSQSTPFPRSCFYLQTYPLRADPPPTQAIILYREDEYAFTNISGGTIEATILRDWNVLELRCVGTTISSYLNGELLISVTDANKTGNRGYWGAVHSTQSNTDARLGYIDFTLL